LAFQQIVGLKWILLADIGRRSDLLALITAASESAQISVGEASNITHRPLTERYKTKQSATEVGGKEVKGHFRKRIP